MRKRNKLIVCAALLLVAAMLLAGCAHPWRVSKVDTGTPTPEASASPEATDEIAASDEPNDPETPTVEPTGETEEPTEAVPDTEVPDTEVPATEAPTGGQEPTDTPKPTDTAKPTEAPKPTDAPKPTEAPKPTDTPKPTEVPSSGDFAAFSAPSLNGGGDFSNATFAQNKLTVVNFWATTCGPCINEMPTLQRIAGEYASKGVKIVTVLGDSETRGCIDSALGIFQGLGVTLPLIRCNASITDAFVKPYGIGAYPFTFFVDSNGNILKQVKAENDYNGWVSLINGLLK